MRVEDQSNEITHAPNLLGTLDLRGVVVTGDAMHAQRALSVQIVQVQGDYLWTAQASQPELREEIEVLFAPQVSRPGWSAVPTDFQRAST